MNSKASVLKIFSDRRYLPPGQGHIVMLYPFWGPNPEDPRDPSCGRFERYRLVGHQYFSMASLAEADIAVLPGEWIAGDVNQQALELSAEAQRLSKPVVIFFNHDSDERIDVENSLIFRTSFHRSTRRPNEFAVPGWSEDFLERYLSGNLLLRPKRPKPVIGYCGYATLGTNSRRKRLRYAIGAVPRIHRLFSLLGVELIEHPGVRLRSQAIHVLSHSKEIETNFIIRGDFWAGALRDGRFDVEVAQRARREFVQNMVESDYVLCTRGMGNFSYRLYESLSCGRIPILIDTDCVLPYDHLIDWKQYCVWVDEKDLSNLAKKVAEFHESLSVRDFQNLQKACRQLWEDWISPQGFFANFHKHFW